MRKKLGLTDSKHGMPVKLSDQQGQGNMRCVCVLVVLVVLVLVGFDVICYTICCQRRGGAVFV